MRLALRRLTQHPWTSLVMVLVVALGIGLTTSLLSVLESTLLEPLPVRESDRVFVMTGTFDGLRHVEVTVEEAQIHGRRNVAIEEMGSFSLGHAVGVETGGSSEGVRLGFADSALFRALGTEARHGRTFAEHEDRGMGAHPVVLLTHGFWHERFADDPAAVGHNLRLAGVDHRVIGVLPPHFPLDGADLWLPFTQSFNHLGPNVLEGLWDRTSFAIGRLSEGASLEEARRRAEEVRDQIAVEHPWAMRDRSVHLESLEEFFYGQLDRPLRVLLLGAGLVLLLCCINVAALLLVTGIARQRDSVLRLALGASRAQVARQFLIEALLLVAAGGALGVLLAYGATASMARSFELGLPSFNRIAVDPQVLLVSLAMVLATGLAVGLVPALAAARNEASDALRGAGRRSANRAAGRQRSGLVAAEVAIAVVLLTSTGLAARGLYRLVQAELGFRTENLVTMRLNLKLDRYSVLSESRDGWLDDDAYQDRMRTRSVLLERLRERATALPGVRSFTVWGPEMLGSSQAQISMVPDSRDPQDELEWVMGQYLTVGPGALSGLGIPVLRGREFTPQDRLDATGVVVLSQRVAERFWPDGDALGRRMFTWADFDEETGQQVYEEWTVVGIAADARHRGRRRALGGGDGYMAGDIYFSALQNPPSDMALLVRTTTAGQPLTRALRDVVREIDPDIAIYDVATFSERLRADEAVPRFAVTLMSIYAGIAALLAIVGTYGVLAYTVSLRRQELAIRSALGADRRSLLRLVLGQGMAPVVAGLAAGVALTLPLSRLLEPLLFETSRLDLTTYGAVAALLTAATVAACLLPAYRASRVSPSAALRQD